jgi:hypothetical protein
MEPRHCHVRPYGALWPKNGSWIGNAVASKLAPFAEHRAEFAQTAGEVRTIEAEMNFTAIVAEVAEFGSGSKVDIPAED